jgi:MFS family permease
VMSIGAVTMFGFVGIALLTVLYLERIAHANALQTGVRMLPMFVAYVVVSAFAARLVRRFGTAATLTAGLLLMGAGALALLMVGPVSGYGAMWPGLLVAGLGSALLVAPSTAAAVNSVPALQAGMAAASVNMFRQLGGVLGPSILGTLVTTRFPEHLRDRLTSAGLPAGAVERIVAGVAHGDTGPVPKTVSVAVPQAFTEAVHLGWLVAGVVLLVTAVPAALLVRRRS